MRKSVFTKYDRRLIYSLLILVAVTFIAQAYIVRSVASDSDREVVVEIGKKGRYFYSVSKNKRIELDGSNGPFAFEVRDGAVRMLHSDCPKKVCVAQGWIRNPGEVIVCAPNQVVVRISGETRKDIDAVSR